MKEKLKILFISHETSLSGAPLVLFNLMKWIGNYKNSVEKHLYLLSGGERLKDFQESSFQTYYFQKKKMGWMLQTIQSFITKKLRLKPEKEKIFDRLSKIGCQIIYANTVLSLEAGVSIKKRGNGKLVLHVHELDTIIKRNCEDFIELAKNVDAFIAVSEAVKACLIQTFGIHPGLIVKIPEFIEPVHHHKTTKHSTNGPFIIGGSGYADWRKGPELFLLTAKYILDSLPDANIKFVWVGKLPGHQQLQLQHDTKKLGIENKIHFTGEIKSPFEYFKTFDLFLMTSREDPLPLVCIEAGMLGVPVLCFRDAGGTEEWIPNTAVVDYLDIKAMADAAVLRIKDKSILVKESNEIMQSASYFTTANLAPEILKVLHNL